MTALLDIEAVDAFAGPGGWDAALRALGIDPLGIEWDDAAVATRAAAGLRTKQADVSKLNPLDFAPCNLFIASAPCPTYSAAGNGGGRHLTALVIRCLYELAAGNDTRAERREEARTLLLPIYWEREQDKARKKKRELDREKTEARARRDADMSLLVVEPLRWVLALQPRFVALEQVPEVLGLWSEIATILGTFGYGTWTGILSAEQYGVAQTRKRAILMASHDGEVKPPRPTHQRYVSPAKEDEDAPAGLFEVPRVDRIVRPEDRSLLPWVSMDEALGWERGTLEHTQRNGSTGEYCERGGDEPAFTAASNADRWIYRNGNRENAAERPVTEPAPTLHFGGRSNKVDWFCDRRQSESAGVRPRLADEPAPTICGTKLGKGVDVWTRERPAPTIVTTRRSDKGILVGRQLGDGEGRNVGGWGWGDEDLAACGCPVGVVDGDGFCACCQAHLDDPDGFYALQGDGSHSHRDCPASRPAPTLTAGGLAKATHQWVRDRPSTAVCGDSRITAPGRADRDPDYRPGDPPPSNKEGAVRVSLEEAAILQSFPPDYPFQGTKSKRFEQVGNAVPPLLAHAILSALLAPALTASSTTRRAA